MKGGLLALGLLCGCGPEAAVWLRVEAPLVIPDAADAVHVRFERAGGELAFDQTFPLGPLERFPATLALENHNPKNHQGPLAFTVRVLKNQALAAPWAQQTGTVQLLRGRTVEATVALCDCSR